MSNISSIMNLASAAEALSARPPIANFTFSGVSTDSRSIKTGDLFIALRGPNFNGNEYVDEVAKAGAVGAIVDEDIISNIPLIKVTDARIALGKLASAQRQRFLKPVIGLTGSNGKTTVKELLSAILSTSGEVLSTEGNLNNDIGVPLTLLRIRDDQDYAVIEMGANHVGEIEYLTSMVKPDIAVITNAGEAHLAGFGSLENIASAKGEIFQFLNHDGVAVINADDSFSMFWKTLAKKSAQITFGIADDNANVRAKNIVEEGKTSGFTLCIAHQEIPIQWSLHGRHNVYNALAAAAVASALNIPIENMAKALSAFSPVKGRLNILHAINNACLIDDSYNANPTSSRAAIDVLANYSRKRILVLGDMKEMGESAAEIHESLGVYAKEKKIDAIYTTGEHGLVTARGFGDSGFYFSTQNELLQALLEVMASDVTVLVKGSRGSKMEIIVEGLKAV